MFACFSERDKRCSLIGYLRKKHLLCILMGDLALILTRLAFISNVFSFQGYFVEVIWYIFLFCFVFFPLSYYYKVEDAVESLSRKILTIQATGDKNKASSLLEEYCKMTNPLRLALDKLESAEVWLFRIYSKGFVTVIVSKLETHILLIGKWIGWFFRNWQAKVASPSQR